MYEDCPSFLVVGGYLYVFLISFAMLWYILFFSLLLELQVNPIVYIITIALILNMIYSAYNIYRSLFPACWL